MTQTKAKVAHGTLNEWSADGGTTYTAIPESTTIVVPEVGVDYQDVTHLQSPGGFREFIPGLKDPGEITIPANYIPATYALAEGYKSNATRIMFRTTLPAYVGQTSGDVFEFSGFVNPQLENNASGDPVMINLAIRVTGAVTHTAGATS